MLQAIFYSNWTRYFFRNTTNRDCTCELTRHLELRSARLLSPQLGNYLGAISNWVKLQNESPPEDDILISIVGWHALTLPQNAKELSTSRTDMLATLLAFGINPKRTTLFYQEDVGLNSFMHLIWSSSHL